MRVAEFADVGQAQHRRVSAVSIQRVAHQQAERYPDAPVFQARIRARAGRNMVRVLNSDRNPRELLEIGLRYGCRSHSAHRWRNFTLRKYVIRRLIGIDTADVGSLDGGDPAQYATRRMREQDRRADLIE